MQYCQFSLKLLAIAVPTLQSKQLCIYYVAFFFITNGLLSYIIFTVRYLCNIDLFRTLFCL